MKKNNLFLIVLLLVFCSSVASANELEKIMSFEEYSRTEEVSVSLVKSAEEKAG